jgi:hypothetical protein
MWRNDEIADCAFAAAADWEMAALHHTPNEGQLIRDFHTAGGSDGQGIEARRYEAWWDRHGIGGVRVHLRELHPTRREVERQLARGHPLIADMNLGDHTITVVGYDTTGRELGDVRRNSSHDLARMARRRLSVRRRRAVSPDAPIRSSQIVSP